MKQDYLNVPYFIIPVPDHQTLKSKILPAIDGMGVHSYREGDQSIYNTDWHIGDVPRPYIDLMQPVYTQSRQVLSNHFNTPIYTENTWYQQYETGDYHGWHTHHAFYNGIYYVELSEDAARTTVNLGYETDIEVKEGTVLLLPGGILHRSSPNLSDMRKTVVVFNMDITYNKRYA